MHKHFHILRGSNSQGAARPLSPRKQASDIFDCWLATKPCNAACFRVPVIPSSVPFPEM